MVTAAVTPRTSRILPRGNWQDDSGEVVEPALPAFLVGDATSSHRLSRLDLAEWLVDASNPLTARVVMNRLWSQFFGTGLCASLDDFGSQGEAPTHPELLDWLAVEFRESGWDVKHMVRLIVTSHTYRQQTGPSPSAEAIDPANQLLSHQRPRRLEAEIVRDNALAIAGLLCPDVGGPPCRPYQPPNYYAHLQFPDRPYAADRDERQYRRAIYTHWHAHVSAPDAGEFRRAFA